MDVATSGREEKERRLMAELSRTTPSSNGERMLIDSSLVLGQALRSIARRYADLKRAHIARHREGCLAEGGAT
jgi:hypothetical protein